MLTSTDFECRQEIVCHSKNFLEIRIPKDRFWRKAYETLQSKDLEGDLSGLAMALAVANPDCNYTIKARMLGLQADVIIHEFPYSEPIFADLCVARKEIYNSHNFELSLIQSVIRGPGAEAALLKVMRLEGNLATRAARVLATSQADVDKFRLIYGVSSNRLSLCPNGFDEIELGQTGGWRSGLAQRMPRRARALFLGSAHHPNVEGVVELIAMAPLVKGCDFLIAGGVCESLQSCTLPDKCSPTRDKSTKMKKMLLNESDIFVNPVVLGSGTSLKALEALGTGIPLLSTPEGVRGLDLEPGIHAAVVDRRNFPEAIAVLLSSPEQTSSHGECRETFRHRALHVVDHRHRPPKRHRARVGVAR